MPNLATLEVASLTASTLWLYNSKSSVLKDTLCVTHKTHFPKYLHKLLSYRHLNYYSHSPSCVNIWEQSCMILNIIQGIFACYRTIDIQHTALQWRNGAKNSVTHLREKKSSVLLWNWQWCRENATQKSENKIMETVVSFSNYVVKVPFIQVRKWCDSIIIHLLWQPIWLRTQSTVYLD